MKKVLFTLFLLISILLGFSFSLGLAQIVGNQTCPVMPGERAKNKFHVDYQGDRIHFCCRNCVKAFKKHPEKYLKNL